MEIKVTFGDILQSYVDVLIIGCHADAAWGGALDRGLRDVDEGFFEKIDPGSLEEGQTVYVPVPETAAKKCNFGAVIFVADDGGMLLSEVALAALQRAEAEDATSVAVASWRVGFIGASFLETDEVSEVNRVTVDQLHVAVQGFNASNPKNVTSVSLNVFAGFDFVHAMAQEFGLEKINIPGSKKSYTIEQLKEKVSRRYERRQLFRLIQRIVERYKFVLLPVAVAVAVVAVSVGLWHFSGSNEDPGSRTLTEQEQTDQRFWTQWDAGDEEVSVSGDTIDLRWRSKGPLEQVLADQNFDVWSIGGAFEYDTAMVELNDGEHGKTIRVHVADKSLAEEERLEKVLEVSVEVFYLLFPEASSSDGQSLGPFRDSPELTAATVNSQSQVRVVYPGLSSDFGPYQGSLPNEDGNGRCY